MSTRMVRSVPNCKEKPFAATALLLFLAGCGGGGGAAPPTDIGNLNWLGGYTGGYSLSFTNAGEQFSESDKYVHISIQQLSGNKFTGIVRLNATQQGPLSGNLPAPTTITVTQFGDENVGTRDLLRSVANRCDAGPAAVSPLSGSMVDGVTLILTGTLTMSCHYQSGTYSTVAKLTISVPKQFDDPCGVLAPPTVVGGVSLSAACAPVR